MLSKNEMTAKLIADSLKKLMLEKPLEKIRIKEITDEAGLMRPTFYNYFQDKYEVVEYIFCQEILEPVRPFLEKGLSREAFHFIVLSLEKDDHFYQREINRFSPTPFKDILFRTLYGFLLPIVKKKMAKSIHPLITPEFFTEYYSNTFVFLLTRWFREGNRIPTDQIMELYDLTISKSLENFLTEIEK